MQVKIIGDNFEITEAISQYLNKRISSIHLPESLQHMEFRLGKEHLIQYVKFFSRSGKKSFSIKQTDTDIYAAIDQLVDRIKKSFKRSKEKGKVSLRKTRVEANKRKTDSIPE